MFFLSGPGLGVVMNVFVAERSLLTLIEIGGGDGQFMFVHRAEVHPAGGQASQVPALVGGAVHHLLVNKLDSLQGGTLGRKSCYESF